MRRLIKHRSNEMLNVFSWLFGGECQHDWVSLAYESQTNIEHRIESELAGRYLPVGPDDDSRVHVRRVCLKCKTVDDPIAKAEAEYRQLCAERNCRERRARAIAERDRWDRSGDEAEANLHEWADFLGRKAVVAAQAEIDQQVSQLFEDMLGADGVAVGLSFSRKEFAELRSLPDDQLRLVYRLARLGHAYMCVTKMAGETT